MTCKQVTSYTKTSLQSMLHQIPQCNTVANALKKNNTRRCALNLVTDSLQACHITSKLKLMVSMKAMSRLLSNILYKVMQKGLEPHIALLVYRKTLLGRGLVSQMQLLTNCFSRTDIPISNMCCVWQCWV